MAVESGILTQGTQFEISIDGVSYTPLGCVESWTVDSPARTEIDTTCLMDTSKSFKFGLKDSGTLNVDLIYDVDGAGQKLLEDSYASDEPYFFQVTYSDAKSGVGTIKQFNGNVISLNETGSKDDVIRNSVGIKISGDITVIPAPVI